MRTVYIVVRVFSKKERPDPIERSVFYGWSPNKHAVKAFLQQRSQGKYDYCKADLEDPNVRRLFPELLDPSGSSDSMIDFMKLKSAASDEEIHIFTTMREMHEAEKRIQYRFHKLCSIDNIDALRLFMSLDMYYRSALELIGFRPDGIDAIFDSADARDEYNTLELTESEIDDAYSGVTITPTEGFFKFMNPPGLSNISTIADKLYYSVENFVTAMRDEL